MKKLSFVSSQWYGTGKSLHSHLPQRAAKTAFFFDTVRCFPYISRKLTSFPTHGLGGADMTRHLIWIDLEMSGLDPEEQVILEIASLVTDGNLDIVAEGPNIAIHHSEEALEGMEDWSREHHQASGLLDRVKSSPMNCRQAEEETLQFFTRHCKKGESPLCGNSIWQDRRFLVKYMPELETFLHYRNIDVSSIKELAGMWYPSLAPFTKDKAHLAMSDILQSIQELRHYRKKIFVP